MVENAARKYDETVYFAVLKLYLKNQSGKYLAMKSNKSTNSLQIVKKFCVSVVSCVLLLSAVCFGAWFDASQAAIAIPMNSQQVMAANPLRGTGDELEGNAEQALGKAQRNLGKVTGQAEGAATQAKGLAKQARGNVKQGIEETKSAADEASENIEEGTENAVDAIKDFFGN